MRSREEGLDLVKLLLAEDDHLLGAVLLLDEADDLALVDLAVCLGGVPVDVGRAVHPVLAADDDRHKVALDLDLRLDERVGDLDGFGVELLP